MRVPLTALERLRDQAGPVVAARRLTLLRQVGRSRLTTAHQVERFHETLCFLRAYPDNPIVAAHVERLLDRFAARPDLRRHADALADSGIAGTIIRYPFFQSTAAWLARRWPDALSIDDDELAAARPALDRLLGLLAHYAETPGLDEVDLGTRAWLQRLAGPHGAAFLVSGLDALPASTFVREYLHDQLQLWLELRAGPDTPNRSHALWRGSGGAALDRASLRHRRWSGLACRQKPLPGGRPDLKGALHDRPKRVSRLKAADGQRLIDLARESMVTRGRDLDVFAYGNPHDVRVIEWGDGLSFGVIGALPERRLLLEGVYGMLTLKNGVPIGYVLLSALWGSSEIAYNVFPTFRGGEAAHVYGRVVATAYHLFQSDTFTVYPYQLGGDGNDEALASGAWWFYRKLGFAPKHPAARRLVRLEEAAMARKSGHRSSIATLKKIAAHNVYFHAGEERDDVIGVLPAARVGLAVTDLLRRRFGHDRALATRVCADEAARAVGMAVGRRGADDALARLGWNADERQAFSRWAPLVVLLRPARWSPDDRRDLVSVIRAKGGRDETAFVRRFDAHRRLRRGVAGLARRTRE